MADRDGTSNKIAVSNRFNQLNFDIIKYLYQFKLFMIYNRFIKLISKF